MAKPFPDEGEMYEKIRQDKITIHPVIWDLLTHHIGNDIQIIMANLEVTILDPEHPKPFTKEMAQQTYEHALSIRALMNKLRKATGKDIEF